MIFTRKTIPTFFRAVWRSFLRAAKCQPVIATRKLQIARTDTCERCIFFRDGQCSECTCFVDTKAMLYDEDCPHGFWPVP